MPTNAELNSSVRQLEARLDALGNLQPQIQQLQQLISTLTTMQIQGNEALTAATASKAKVDEVIASATALEKNLTGLVDKTQALNTTAENSSNLLLERLGVANAEVLARSFGDQAQSLLNSSKKWWNSLKLWVCLIVIAVAGVVAWEAQTTANFTSGAFVLKFALITPIAYMAYSASRQHRIETNLIHQYNFKASVASSLEAYRQLLEHNIPFDAEGDKIPVSQDKLNEFLEQRIAAVFREPVENFIRVDDDAFDGLIIGFQGKVTSALKRILSPKKNNNH